MSSIKEIIKESLTNFANSIKETYTKKNDIIDNLDSTDSTKPLSANMGNNIKNQIDILDSNTSNISTSCLSNYAIGITITFEELVAARLPRFFTNWHDGNNFPSVYGSGIYIPGLDANNGYMIYFVGEKLYTRYMGGGGVWGDWKQMI